MSSNFLRSMGSRIRSWFDDQAEQVTVKFVPEVDSVPLLPQGGYFRLWLAEGFLAQRVSWGVTHFPALYGSVTLQFLGAGPTAFAKFQRPPDKWTIPGVQLDFPLTPLVPFNGGIVEVEAALYQASTASPLGAAVELAGQVAELVGPPLSTAAVIADKISSGLDCVLNATGDQPVLGLHRTLVSPGGGGQLLQAGTIVVVNGVVTGELKILDGRICTGSGDLLSGVDYLAVRVECRTERDDWFTADMRSHYNSALLAHHTKKKALFQDHMSTLLSLVWTSVDLTPEDQVRAAQAIEKSVDKATAQSGAVPEATDIRLPAHDAPGLSELTLQKLLSNAQAQADRLD